MPHGSAPSRRAARGWSGGGTRRPACGGGAVSRRGPARRRPARSGGRAPPPRQHTSDATTGRCERAALSSRSHRGRFHTLARTTPLRAVNRSARALLPTPAGPTSSTSRGRVVSFSGAITTSQLPPYDGLQTGQDVVERPAGVDHVRARGTPIRRPHDVAAPANVLLRLVGLAPYGDLGVDPQHDEQIRRQDAPVVARFRRQQPPTQAGPAEWSRERVEPGAGELGGQGHGVALAQRDPAPDREATGADVEAVTVAGR